jgi:hypothetical protein
MDNFHEVMPQIDEALHFIMTYASEIKEWKELKKELMKCLHPRLRKSFSTRDPVTKKQNFNEFEKIVFQRWKDMTIKP